MSATAIASVDDEAKDTAATAAIDVAVVAVGIVNAAAGGEISVAVAVFLHLWNLRWWRMLL